MKKVFFVFFLATLSLDAFSQVREETKPISHDDPGLFMWGYAVTPCALEGGGINGSIKGSLGSFYDTLNVEAAAHLLFYIGYEADGSDAPLLRFPLSLSPRVNILKQNRYQPISLSFQPDFIYVLGRPMINYGGTLLFTSHRMSFGLVFWPSIFYGVTVGIYNF